MRTSWIPMLVALLLTGCYEQTPVAPDTWAPSAPRGVRSVTGDHEVVVSWLANPEPDVEGYRVYVGTCPGGPGCPYDPIGTTRATSFVVSPLENGRTLYYGVTAYDHAGNESELSHDDVFDTPRPEGSGLLLANVFVDSLRAGYDFSRYSVLPYDDPEVDIFYGVRDGVPLMVAPFVDTDLQDAGYAASLDAVDFAPTAGWSSTGAVELIPGHCYVVRTYDNHYAKFRVTSLTTGRVVIDWAYQVDPGNRELKARPESGRTGPRTRRAITWPGGGA